MAGIAAWFDNNWFSLLQSAGIVCGLLATAVSIRRDSRARQSSDLLALSERHQKLWSELYHRPELARIKDDVVDLIAQPVTRAEKDFLESAVFVHFYTGWLLAKNGALLPLEAMASDIRDFFSLPIPKSVWKQSQQRRDPNFIAFVNNCLS